MKSALISLLLMFCGFSAAAFDTPKQLISKGWSELVKDNDTSAIKYFNEAYLMAISEGDIAIQADALLHLGIASYGSSLSNGLKYATSALKKYNELEISSPLKALSGRSKCYQLISTIKSRQGKYREAIDLSLLAIKGIESATDTGGYRGLIYNSLGSCYAKLNLVDSSAYYFRLSLKNHLFNYNTTYLPGAYLGVAGIEQKNGNKLLSKQYIEKALFIADSTENKQAKVLALLAQGRWVQKFEADFEHAIDYFVQAQNIAQLLTDKSFYLATLLELNKCYKNQELFAEALACNELILLVKDTIASLEKNRIVNSLEVQFKVAEKERQLKLIQKEKNIITLTNYLLWGSILFVVMLAGAIIIFLRKINERNRKLLLAESELVKITKEQKKLSEQKMQNELEFKESQLHSVALQMMQKNELLQELDEKLKEASGGNADASLSKIINKGLTQDKEWSDFNTSFESINKNFYSRIQQAYPDISPNDLKICALIKMNLSIKEMAGILNISPDSVKTARYRLRKKLQLNSEDNLTDFILNIQ
jgi:DNA-binding CsgD family transcriptional regulator